VHLRAPSAAEAAAYQVNGYPSYYLIGRDGRLIKKYALRPSDGTETVAAIEAALKGLTGLAASRGPFLAHELLGVPAQTF